MSIRKVIKNTIWYSLAGYIPLISSFFLLPIYTKYLSPSDYGTIALIQTFVSIVSIFVTLQLHKAIGKFFVDFDGEDLATYLSTILFSCLGLAFLCISIIIYFFDAINNVIFTNQNFSFYPFFLYALLTVLFTVLGSVFKSVLLFQQKASTVFFIEFPISILNIGLYFFHIVFLEHGVLGSVLSSFYYSILTSIFFFAVTRSYFKLRFNYIYLKPSILFTLPLIPHAISGFIFISSDKLVLEKYLSIYFIGLYAIAVKFVSPVKTLVDNFNTAYTPKLIKEYKVNPDDCMASFIKLSSIFYCLTLLTVYFVYLFAHEFLVLLTKPNFYSAQYLIMILSFCYLFRVFYGFFGTSIILSGKSWVFPLITLVSGVLNLILNIMFIPIYGIYMAAITTLCSYFVQLALSFYFSRKYLPIKLDNIRIIISIPILTLFFSFPLVLGFENFFANLFLKLIIYLVFVCFLFLLFKKYIPVGFIYSKIRNII